MAMDVGSLLLVGRCHEEVDEVLELRLRQRLPEVRGHDALGVALGDLGVRVDDRSSRSNAAILAREHLVEVGADLAARARLGQRVAGAAAGAREHGLAGVGVRGGGRRRGRRRAARGGRRDRVLVAVGRGGLVGGLDARLLGDDPRLVLLDGHDADLGEHVRVAAAAELGALALVDAEAVRLEPGLVRVAGDRVELAAELGDPPRVRDVLGADVEGHRGVDGDDHLLVGVGVVLRVGVAVGVGVAPEVLLAVDVDVQRLAARRRRLVGGGELGAGRGVQAARRSTGSGS